MPANYYEPEDLADFPNIAEFAPEQGPRFLIITPSQLRRAH